MTYDVWVMTRKDDRRVGRFPEKLPAISHAKSRIQPQNYVRVECWNETCDVVWDSLDGCSARRGRKSQLRDFIRRPRKRPKGGLR